MVPIQRRPKEATYRLVLGHWEGGLVVGRRGGSHVGTLVERRSRYFRLLHLPGGAGTDSVIVALTAAMHQLPPVLRRSVTWDRGIEMTRHHVFTAHTKMPVFFCDARSPWQRGSNENTNTQQQAPTHPELADSKRGLDRQRCDDRLRAPARGVQFSASVDKWETMWTLLLSSRLAIPAMHTEQVIFIHIPKAAGQTMRAIVARQYPRQEIMAIEGRLGQTRLRSHEDTKQTRIFIGHIHYGFHQHLQRASTYVTILQEPVSRVLSLYRYIATNPQHYLHEEVANKGLIDFVSSQVDVEEVENGQTRQIAGVTEGIPDTSSLARAKQNLAEAFAAVGLVERFDESLVLFKRRLGWKMPFYVRKNVTQRSLAEKATDEAREIIGSRNTLDTELYGFGCELFQEHVRREGPLFDAEVSVFQTLNAGARVYRDVREWGRHLGSKGARNT